MHSDWLRSEVKKIKDKYSNADTRKGFYLDNTLRESRRNVEEAKSELARLNYHYPEWYILRHYIIALAIGFIVFLILLMIGSNNLPLVAILSFVAGPAAGWKFANSGILGKMASDGSLTPAEIHKAKKDCVTRIAENEAQIRDIEQNRERYVAEYVEELNRLCQSETEAMKKSFVDGTTNAYAAMKNTQFPDRVSPALGAEVKEMIRAHMGRASQVKLRINVDLKEVLISTDTGMHKKISYSQCSLRNLKDLYEQCALARLCYKQVKLEAVMLDPNIQVSGEQNDGCMDIVIRL